MRRRQPQRPQAAEGHPRRAPRRPAEADRKLTPGSLPRCRLRQRGEPPARRRLRLYGPHPQPRRGDRGEAADARLAGATLGGRGLPFLAEPQPRPARALVEEGREPPRPADARLRPDRLQESTHGDARQGPIGIGPKGERRGIASPARPHSAVGALAPRCRRRAPRAVILLTPGTAVREHRSDG